MFLSCDYVLFSLISYMCLAFLHLQTVTGNNGDSVSDDDSDDVVRMNPVTLLLLIPGLAVCRQGTPARASLTCLLKRTCLFAFHFREKIIAFFIFGHSKSKQVVPSALRHTLSAQSTALRSVFYTDGCRPSDLFVSDIFPWQTEPNTKTSWWPGETTG